MLRGLYTLLLMFVSAGSFAQKNGDNPVKTTEKKNDTQIDYKQIGAPMPPIRMILYTDTSKKNSPQDNALNTRRKKKDRNGSGIAEGPKIILTNADVDNGANLFVMLFNPTCSHCEDETAMIEQNISLFKRSKFLMMISPQARPYLPDFVNMMHVMDYPAFTVGVDSARYVDDVFLYQSLPQINIYNAKRKLIKVYTGEAPIDSLKQYIE